MLVVNSLSSCTLNGDLNVDNSACRPGIGTEGDSENPSAFLLIFVFALEDLGILQFLSRGSLNLLLCFSAHKVRNPRRKAGKGTISGSKVDLLRVVI